MKKKLVMVLLTCSMVVSMLCACSDSEDSSRKKDKNRTESVDEDDDEDKKESSKEKKDKEKKEERKSVLTGTEWEDEPWTYDPWTGTTVAVVEPMPEPVPEPLPEPEYEPVQDDPYTIICDPATGRPYDLGGMEIIVRNWWSDPDREPLNQYEDTRDEYIDWLEATYNFTIKEIGISAWDVVGQDFVDYVTTGGDTQNYVFILHNDFGDITSAMHQGLLYDLSSLDCLDFTEEKFQTNKVHLQYSHEGKIFGMHGWDAEPRGGMFFNKRLLEDAGIDPATIYDWQLKGEWTWDNWVYIMSKVQRDIDNDGIIDVYGFDASISDTVLQAIYSNGGEIVGMENGQYVYKLDNAETVEALEWYVDTLMDFAIDRPEGAYWDYYKQAFVNGECAFMPENASAGTTAGWLEAYGMEDEIGFATFPYGPEANGNVNCWESECAVIPGCYDADRAWKIAFAYNLYTGEVPEFEDYTDLSTYEYGLFDYRAVTETIPMMMEPDGGMVTYHTMIPNMEIYDSFIYQVDAWTNIPDLLSSVRDYYIGCVDRANQ